MSEEYESCDICKDITSGKIPNNIMNNLDRLHDQTLICTTKLFLEELEKRSLLRRLKEHE